MKKILFSALALCSFASAFAQDYVEVKPAVYEAGKAVLSFVTTGQNTPTGVQVFFYVPDGWTVDKTTVVKGSALSDHTCTVSKKSNDLTGYAKYQLMVASLAGTEFNSNEVCTVVATGPATDAIVPVVLKKGKIAAVDEDGEAVNTTTEQAASYIKVGNPTNVTYAPEGVLTEALNEALVNEPAITTLDLSKVTGVVGDFAYTVGRAVTAPSTAVKANVKVAATTAGDYMSLKSPVALPGVACYTYNKVEGDVAYFVEAANVPADETVIVAGNVEETVANATLVSVANGSATSGCYISNDGKELRRVNGTVKVPALRGTFDIPAGSNLRIALETPTGIKMIGTADEVFGNTYDLQGRQVENAHNGVYVVNGKKQFVK